MAAFDYATMHLTGCAKVNQQATAAAAYAWLQSSEAGFPMVPIVEEDVRSSAALWVNTATPVELECYFVAASIRLAEIGTFTTSRHIKRLIASLWQRMSPSEQEAFMGWANKGGSNK